METTPAPGTLRRAILDHAATAPSPKLLQGLTGLGPSFIPLSLTPAQRRDVKALVKRFQEENAETHRVALENLENHWGIVGDKPWCGGSNWKPKGPDTILGDRPWGDPAPADIDRHLREMSLWEHVRACWAILGSLFRR